MKFQCKSAYIYIIIIALIGLFLRTLWLNVGLGFSDENLYYEASKAVINNPMYVMNLVVIHTHPPLHWLVFPFMTYLSPNLLSMRFASSVIGTLIIIILYYFVNRYIGKTEALFSAILFAITGYYVILSRIAYPSISVLSMFVLLIFVFLRFLTKPYLINALLYGMILTIAILLKEGSIMFIPAVLLFLVWNRMWHILKSKYFWIGTLFPFILIIPILVYTVYYILPNHIQGLTIFELPGFYQLYLGRETHLMNIPYGIYRVFYMFAKFSSIPIFVLLLIGTAHSLIRRNLLDKYLLSITFVFLIFFSSMGNPIDFKNYTPEGFIDWHPKWIFLPMLIMTSMLMSRFKYTQVTIPIIVVFMIYTIYYDIHAIQTMNDFMINNYASLPLISDDPKAETIARLFNATKI